VFDAHEELRERTRERHRRLEACGAFARIMAPGVSIADYGAFLSALHRFLAAFEPPLLGRIRGTRLRPLYRRRLALLASDLESLGLATPPSAAVPGPPDSPCGLLGAIYAIEGSAIGGQFIARHCRRVIGEQLEPSMRYVTGLAPDSDNHWQRVLGAVRQDLTSDPDLDGAAAGANAVFDGLLAVADCRTGGLWGTSAKNAGAGARGI
jgi:heme oxygenase